MRKRIFKKISVSIALAGSLMCTGAYFSQIKAYDNIVEIGQTASKKLQMLINSDSSGYALNATGKPILAYVGMESYGIIDIQFNKNYALTDRPIDGYSENNLDDPGNGMVYFAVFKDRITGKIIETKPLNGNKYDGNSHFEVSYQMVPNVDVIDVSIHKQSAAEPIYVPTSENFVGRLRLFSGTNDVFLRTSNTKVNITQYKNDGSAVTDEKSMSLLYSRLTPDLFTIFLNSDAIGSMLKDGNYIGKIEPVAGEGANSMTDQDKLVPLTEFLTYDFPNAVVVEGTKAIPATTQNEDGTYNANGLYSFYLPQNVNEFVFKIYKDNVAPANLQVQYHIILKRS